jgi:hypothetical protein
MSRPIAARVAQATFSDSTGILKHVVVLNRAGSRSLAESSAWAANSSEHNLIVWQIILAQPATSNLASRGRETLGATP